MSGLLFPCRVSPLPMAALLLAAGAAFGACGSRNSESRSAPPAPLSAQGSAKATPAARLVVVVVLDQLSSEALAVHAPHLSKDGLIRRAMDSGSYAERVHFDYAGTNTAPGHASIFTGELPRDHGVDTNDVFDYASGKKTSIVSDEKHLVFGGEGDTASPHRLLKPTVGDLLRKASPDSKVVSVSLKARSAIAMGGSSANFAAWYDDAQGSITTSSYYADAMPAWLSSWNQANPIDARLTTWSTDRADIYQELLGPDDAPGEADWYGYGTTFPHEQDDSERPRTTFLSSPQSAEYLCDLAAAASEHFQLGKDASPDLLAVSISSTDYAGHIFGWQSWEFADALYKSDLALGALIRNLEATTEVAVVITSDHGGTPLAESLAATGEPGGRLDSKELVAALEAKADATLGAGNWIQTYAQPYLWLHADARQSDKLDELHALISEHAAAHPGIHLAVATATARGWRDSSDAIERDVANTVAPASDAVFIVPGQGYIASPGGGMLGTGHGTPWKWDREVPVLTFGPGVPASRNSESSTQLRVAATIAALVGVDWHLPATPLFDASASR